MYNQATLSLPVHDGDLVAALRNEGPWSEPADGASGLLNAILVHLVEQRDSNPAVVGDGAFLSLHDTHRFAAGAGHTRSEADTRDALLALEAERLVESVGRRLGTARWRATDHGAATIHFAR